MKISILQNNNLNFIDKIKDKTSIISYNKIIEKINNNDILKYPANNDVINFYIILELLVKINSHDSIYIIPNNNNQKQIYNNLLKILSKYNNIEIFCIESVTSNLDYFIYKTNILNKSKWVVEYNNKIVHSEIKLNDIKNHMVGTIFNKIGTYCYYNNNKLIEDSLFSF